MGARCQYPVSGDRALGTQRLCGNAASHYFDFSKSYMTSHRVVCAAHSEDPSGLYPGKNAKRIGEK